MRDKKRRKQRMRVMDSDNERKRESAKERKNTE